MEHSDRQPEHKENKDLSNTAIGIRIYHLNKFDEGSLSKLKTQIETVKKFAEKIKSAHGEMAPQIIIISNDDLDAAGKELLNESGLTIAWTNPAKAKRRATLARKIIGEKSKSKGNVSMPDMINRLEEFSKEQGDEKKHYVLASADLTDKPELLNKQIEAMVRARDYFEQHAEHEIALVGGLVPQTHDPNLIQSAIDGETDLTIENLHKVFPNNALDSFAPGSRFSGITDNGLAGEIKINDQTAPIGGTDDFQYGFQEMLFRNKKCVLLIEPMIESDTRTGEVRTVELKYLRRPIVHRLLAERYIKMAQDRNISKGSVEEVIESLIDNNLFFARIDKNGKPEIILTKRQKLKGVKPLI